MRLRLLIRLLPVLLAVAALAATARADGDSGPDRSTLVTNRWGTLYYRGAVEERYQMEKDYLGRVIFKRRGVEIQVSLEPDMGVHYTDGSDLFVRPDGSEVRVLLRGQESWLRKRQNGFTVRIPGDTISFDRKGGEVRIQGKEGTVVVTEPPLKQGFRVASPRGVTTYERGPNGFELRGPRMGEHPYLRRGVHFEYEGVGFFLDFHLEDMGRAFQLLPWEPLILVTPPAK